MISLVGSSVRLNCCTNNSPWPPITAEFHGSTTWLSARRARSPRPRSNATVGAPLFDQPDAAAVAAAVRALARTSRAYLHPIALYSLDARIWYVNALWLRALGLWLFAPITYAERPAFVDLVIQNALANR